MKDISQTIPFNINNTIACKRFMEAKIDGILIILGRKMRLIWLCFIVTSLITEAGVDIMDIMKPIYNFKAADGEVPWKKKEEKRI